MTYDDAGGFLHQGSSFSSSTKTRRRTLECPRCGYVWIPRRPETADKAWIKCPACRRDFKNLQYRKPVLEAINEFFQKLKVDYPEYFNELERTRVFAIYALKYGIDDNVFEQLLSVIKNKNTTHEHG